MENRILSDLKDSFGLNCKQITPVTGGWLNQKWKVSTDGCDVLVKQFSNKRVNKEKLLLIEAALQRQIILAKKGVLCPYIWQYEGRAIRMLDSETAYMVMDFHSGKLESPKTISLGQMSSLGSACGQMHKALSQLPVNSVNGFPIDSNQVIDSLWVNFNASIQKYSSAPDEYHNAVLAQEPILNQFAAGFFDKLPKGIGHEDFSWDNILFEEDRVSAIIDFDRNCYSFIWHDIGRAILSFALIDNRLDTDRILAFIEGYSQHSVLTLTNVADALRLTWCIEVPWWIQPESFKDDRAPKVVRFRDEMLWLTEHWPELDSLLLNEEKVT